MATWGEVVAHLRERHALVRLEADWVGLRATVPLASGHLEQPFRAERAAVQGEDWLLVLVRVAGKQEMAAEEALARNLHLPFGGFALEGDDVILRAAWPLAPLGLDVLEAMVGSLVREAALLYRPRADRSAPFEAFGE
jgi:hypothetical protein